MNIQNVLKRLRYTDYILIFQTEQLQIFAQCPLKDAQIKTIFLLKCLVCNLLSSRHTGLT